MPSSDHNRTRRTQPSYQPKRQGSIREALATLKREKLLPETATQKSLRKAVNAASDWEGLRFRCRYGGMKDTPMVGIRIMLDVDKEDIEGMAMARRVGEADPLGLKCVLAKEDQTVVLAAGQTSEITLPSDPSAATTEILPLLLAKAWQLVESSSTDTQIKGLQVLTRLIEPYLNPEESPEAPDEFDEYTQRFKAEFGRLRPAPDPSPDDRDPQDPDENAGCSEPGPEQFPAAVS